MPLHVVSSDTVKARCRTVGENFQTQLLGSAPSQTAAALKMVFAKQGGQLVSSLGCIYPCREVLGEQLSIILSLQLLSSADEEEDSLVLVSANRAGMRG